MERLIFGRHPILEALRSEAPIEKLYLLYGTRGSAIQTIQQLARQRGIPFNEIDRRRFLELCPDPNAQGVLALLGSVRTVEPEDILEIARGKNEPPFLLVLDEIEDPHNMGALIRTAECAGSHGVVIPRHHSAPLTETVTKASAGASLHLPLARVTNIAVTLDALREQGVWTIGTDMAATRSYDSVDYSGPIAIVIGNEGKGIRKLVKEKCDFLVKIPMYGTIESLNASVAAGLILFEAAKSRHPKG